MIQIDKERTLLALRNYPVGDVSWDDLNILNSFSNKVWKVNCRNGLYILRQYLRMNCQSALYLNENLAYLRQKGIPIPRTYFNLAGNYITQVDADIFDLSEFIEHTQLKYPDMNVSDTQIASGAKILSDIHAIPLNDLPHLVSNISVEESNVNQVLRLVDEFLGIYPKILRKANIIDKNKLITLRELILITHKRRMELADSNQCIENLPKALTHGDFSLTNILPSPYGNLLFIIDWENIGIRPKIWELHRSLLLICGKGKCNANLDELDFRRAQIFFAAYLSRTKLSSNEILAMPQIAEYIANIHWLRFTLESILRGDNRILERIPDNPEEGLWWQNNLIVYKDWLQAFINKRLT